MRVTLKSEKGKKAQRKFASPSARTEISLDERLRIRGALQADVAEDTSEAPPWIHGEEADHIIFIGHNGYADRELVAANSRDDAVRIVIEKAVRAAAKDSSDLAIYCHGGLNSRTDGVKRAQILGPWLKANGIWPLFVVWQTGFRESAGDLIKIGLEKLGLPTETVEGWVIDKVREGRDGAFEVFARDVGVRAIWENMKSRAAGASLKMGGLAVAADCLRAALDTQTPNKRPNIHLMGHSADAIMQGHFLSVLAPLSVSTIHLWAPACTVPFATVTYGAAFTKGVADPKKTFVGALSDANEKSDPCVPALYSKSLLYLVSRALETNHKTPILGLERAWLNGKDDGAFMEGYEKQLADWRNVSKGVEFDDPIVRTEVPIRREKNKEETIDANHGSFDNNIDVVNLAIARILGKKPPVPVTDLRGF